MAGKHVLLRSEFATSRKRTVKITIQDLPLHAVDNVQVLEAIGKTYAVSSEVMYGMLWHNGQPTSIRNGDHYLYMAEDVAAAMPIVMTIAGFDAQIFKLPALTKCHRCGEVGHRSNDVKCLGRAPEAIAATVEPIRGGHHPLSNLYVCPEGCTLPDGQYDFPSAEHHYQFKYLHYHGKLEESYLVLEADIGLQARKIAHSVLPEEDVKPSWQESAVKEMLDTNILKYKSCSHAKDMLMGSKVVLAEVTSNAFWGSSLPPDLTVTTLSDYWPSKNNLGKILV